MPEYYFRFTPNFRHSTQDFRCWVYSGHPNVAVGLLLLTRSGHSAYMESLAGTAWNFAENVRMGGAAYTLIEGGVSRCGPVAQSACLSH